MGKIQAEDNAGHSADRVAEQKNDLNQQGKEKKYSQMIMLDTVQPCSRTKQMI